MLTLRSNWQRLILGPGWPGLLLLLSTLLLQAQHGPGWRNFRAEGLGDSIVTAISFSPRSNVWVRTAESDGLAMLDGFSVTNLPAPNNGSVRVYENRSRQLWSLSPRGLLEFSKGQWLTHPIEDVRRAMQDDGLRYLRQTSLLLTEHDKVLLLLSDRLGEYDNQKEKWSVLKRVTETRLGRFHEMGFSHDGGVIVAGQHGIARIAGPARRTDAAAVWRELPYPDGYVFNGGQRIFEDELGGLCLVLQSVQSDQRMLVRSEGAGWSFSEVRDEGLRAWWLGEDGSAWILSKNVMRHVRYPRITQLISEERISGQVLDWALEGVGRFWLATGEGIYRYSAPAWRIPNEISDLDSPVVGAVLRDDGSVWFAGNQGLFGFDHAEWTRRRWPADFETELRPQDEIYQSQGQLAVSTPLKVLTLAGEAGEFRELRPEVDGRVVRVLGTNNAGAFLLSVQRRSGAFEVWSKSQALWNLVLNSTQTFRMNNELFAAAETRKGELFISSASRIGVLRNGKVRLFTSEDGMLLERAYCFLEFEDGRIWAGGPGLIQEWNGRRWSVVKDRLERVSSLTRSRDGSIWVASGSGLWRMRDGNWVQMGVEEGLPGTSVYRVLEDYRGNLWAATSHGIALYHPDADTDPPQTRIIGKDVEGRRLSPDQLVFEFRGRDRWNQTPADRVLYSYRLNEGAWGALQSAAQVVFNELPGGKHHLEVMAMDRNWNQESQPARFEFIAMVPWYREPRLVVLSGLGLLAVTALAALAVNRHLKLKRSYAEVGRIVAQRTFELEQANAELLHNQKMKALGTLAAGVAHDFNNILSIIKGSAQIIETNLDKRDKVMTRIERIKTVVDQGSGIVKAILGLSRVAEEDAAPGDVNELVRSTVQILGDRFLGEVKFELALAPNLPPVKLVADVLQQVLLNFSVNAADAMGGHGVIRFETAVRDHLQGVFALPPANALKYVAITAVDHGVGIAPEVLPRIFEPFYTTKAMSSKRGTGLGLSMVYEFARELGWGIQVESTPGVGSRFTILLPLVGVEPLLSTRAGIDKRIRKA